MVTGLMGEGRALKIEPLEPLKPLEPLVVLHYYLEELKELKDGFYHTPLPRMWVISVTSSTHGRGGAHLKSK